jgi:hypothetical protein
VREPVRQVALPLGGSLDIGVSRTLGAEVGMVQAPDEDSAQQACLRLP